MASKAYEDFLKKRQSGSTNTSPAYQAFLANRKPDLTTSGGLMSVAEGAGGAVAAQANKTPSLWQKAGRALKKGVSTGLDILSRPNYAIATATKNAIDDDASTTAFGGLYTGITGRTKHTFHDVLSEAGVNPTTRAGKVGKAIGGFALDVLLDPTTYVTLGASATVKVGGKALSKDGMKLLAKGMAQKSGQEFGQDFVKTALARLADSSPELAKKFYDQGGIKFFGNTIISGGRIAAVVNAIPLVNKVDEATVPVRNTLYALFNRDASKMGRLPQEFVQLKQKYLDLGRVKSDQAVNAVVDIANANKLNYQEASIIADAIESGRHLADDRLETAAIEIRRVLGRSLKDEHNAGIQTGNLPNYVPHILVDTKVKNIPFKPEGVRVSLGAANERTIDGTIKQINESFGKDFFDENILRATAVRSVASARATTSAEFLREVTQKFGTKAETAPTGYIESTVRELAGYKFHPAIVDQIDNFKKALVSDDATNELLRAFDKMQGLWKASVTSIFPAFHGRNAISNVFLNFLDIGLDSINPAKHKLAGTLMRLNNKASKLEVALKGGKASKAELDNLLNQPVLTDIAGKQWTFGELRKEITEKRVAFGDEFVGFLDIRETIDDKLGQLAKTTGQKVKGKLQKVNPFSQQNVAFKTGRKVGNVIEEQARLVNFLTNLQKTGDVTHSANRTKQFLFDYQNLSQFEKTVLRRLIPFYTFARKNFELQVTQVVKQPGKFATMAKGIRTISDLFGQAGLSEEEKAALPDWLTEGLGIVVGRKDGNIQSISKLGLPVESAIDIIIPSKVLGSLTPVLSVPLQAHLKKDFFTGRELSNDATAFQDAPQAVKDYIGYTTRTNKDGTIRHIALDPTRLFILSSVPPSSRVITTVKQFEKENISGKLKLLQFLTGTKVYDHNLEDEAGYKEKARFRELQDMLEDSGVAPTFKRSFIPKK